MAIGLTRHRLRRWPLDLAQPVVTFDATFWWVDDDGTQVSVRADSYSVFAC